MAARGSRGFSLIEAIIALALIGLVVAKISFVVGESREAHFRESAQMALEDQASRVLDRVAFAVIGADADRIDPEVEFPVSYGVIKFRISMGVDDDGDEILGDPEEIGLRSGSQLYWGQNVGEPDERLVVWCNAVSEYLEGEIEDGADNNGNELDDEWGLSFDKVGRSVTIRLTLRRTNTEGELVMVTKETMVTCRN